MNEIKLGDKVRSKVSGFEGTVTGIAEHLYGPKRAQVMAPDPINGRTYAEWLPIKELELSEVARWD